MFRAERLFGMKSGLLEAAFELVFIETNISGRDRIVEAMAC